MPFPVPAAAAFAAATRDARSGDTPNAAGLFVNRSPADFAIFPPLLGPSERLELPSLGELLLVGPARMSNEVPLEEGCAGAVDGRSGNSSRAAVIARMSVWKRTQSSSPANQCFM